MGKVLSLANLAIARYISLTPAVRTLMLLQVVALLLNLCGAFEPPKTLRNVPLDRSDVGRTGLSPEPTCGQYLAPSILPGAGLGMYSGVEIEEDDPVSYGDICIPLIDLKLHVGNDDNDFYNPFAAYVWQASALGMIDLNLSKDVSAFCMGINSIANCHLPLKHAYQTKPEYDPQVLRHRHASVGSFTPYFNLTSFAARPIPSGSEIFKSYGNYWFETRSDTFGQQFPLSTSYKEASNLLEKLFVSMKLTSSLSASLYDEVVLSIKELLPSRTMNAFPDTVPYAILGAHESLAAVHQTLVIRDLEWLRLNGRCLDHIRPGTSTLENVGHGAFATRDLSSGTIVSASPVHHIERAFTQMYEVRYDEAAKKHVPDKSKIVAYQLLLNYCFGHNESTVLVCPYGNGVNYINHVREHANVKVRWAQDFPAHQDDVLHQATPEDLFNSTAEPKFVLEYIALRDIVAGEEIFLDYGESWDAAWNAHSLSYEPFGGSTSAERYRDAFWVNENHGDMPLRTRQEQIVDPYPDNWVLRVHPWVLQHHIKYGYLSGNYDWQESDRTPLRDDFGLPCQILERHENGTIPHKYTILADTTSVDWFEKDSVAISQVPRSALTWLNAPGTMDFYLPNAFRQPIGLPDEMMPTQWRNLLAK
jgi:hypothetical protein